MSDLAMLRVLDLPALAQGEGVLEGRVEAAALDRLWEDLNGDAQPVQAIAWRIRVQWRESTGQPAQLWMHLQARAQLPLTCQRCLGPVLQPVPVDRFFRFVDSEEEAQAQDEDCEEDLLVLEKRFDFLELLEDELLLELPLVPMHERCPQDLSVHAGPLESPAHPFAALARLKKPS
ncbi:MAG: YceD family protein [Betaproteobacteria bacterium]